MSYSAILLGIVAALAAVIPRVLYKYLGDGTWLSVSSPIFLLGIASAAMLLQRFVLDRRPGNRSFDGLADLFRHVHFSSRPDPALRWSVRGAISMLLAFFGASVGAEGAAIEFAHAFALRLRARSARWFEQRRRTDASSSISAGIAAAFGAPFSGVILPLELGLGGSTVSTAIAALSGYLFSRSLLSWTGVDGFDWGSAIYGFKMVHIKQWLGCAGIGLVVGLAGSGLIRFVRYSKESLQDLFQTQTWMRTLTAGILLFVVAIIYRSGHGPAWSHFEQAVWSKRSPQESALFFATGAVGFSAALAGFGTTGMIWPLLALGAFLGNGIHHLILRDFMDASSATSMISGAALVSAVMGTPIAAAILVYEMTQNGTVLLPCLMAGLIALQLRRATKTPSLVEADLESRGFKLLGGKSRSVLDALWVKDAIVNDYDIVHEQEPVAELYNRLLNSKYPFFPVVNTQGTYAGLLTFDRIQEAWQSQESSVTSNSPLSKLLEAKDLLYRSGTKAPVVKVTDRLTAAIILFRHVPCVAVVSEDGRVVGLLFNHCVRLAYDQEIMRRSPALERQEV